MHKSFAISLRLLPVLSCQLVVAINPTDSSFIAIQPDANILLQTRSVTSPGTHPTRSISSANCLQSPVPLAQVLILTTNTSEGQFRRQRLQMDLAKLGVAPRCVQMIYGLDAQRLDSEQAMMDQVRLPVQQQAEWMNTTLGFGHRIHGKMDAAHYPANGALACSLGHYEMWKIAATTPPGQWTLILEDDARVPETIANGKSLEKLLLRLPREVDLVHVDDRHCKCFVGKGQPSKDCRYALRSIRGTAQPIFGGVGSTAYAVTGFGARALLSERFNMGADFWLNVPVHSGKIKAFCPSIRDAIFMHNYGHKTEIWSSMFQRSLSEVLR